MSPLFRSRKTPILLLAFGLLFFYFAGIIARCHYGIRILLHNQSGVVLSQVILKLEDNKSYPFKDLLPGSHLRTFVRPVTASSIKLEFATPDGALHSEVIDGYVESGYCGEVDVIVLADGRVEAKNRESLLVNWRSWMGFL